MQRVASRRHGGDGELALLVRYRKVLSGEHHHYRTHFRMDVAENVRNPVAIETDGARGARLVESKVEALAVEQREHIVEPGIQVGKIHRGAFGNNQHVRLET